MYREWAPTAPTCYSIFPHPHARAEHTRSTTRQPDKRALPMGCIYHAFRMHMGKNASDPPSQDKSTKGVAGGLPVDACIRIRMQEAGKKRELGRAQRRAEGRKACRASPESPASPAQPRTVTHPHAESPNVKCGPTRRTRRRIGPQLSPARARLELESDMPFAQWGSARATRVAAELARPKLAT